MEGIIFGVIWVIFIIHFLLKRKLFIDKISKGRALSHIGFFEQFRDINEYLKGANISFYEKFILKYSTIIWITLFILFLYGSIGIWLYRFFSR